MKLGRSPSRMHSRHDIAVPVLSGHVFRRSKPPAACIPSAVFKYTRSVNVVETTAGTAAKVSHFTPTLHRPSPSFVPHPTTLAADWNKHTYLLQTGRLFARRVSRGVLVWHTVVGAYMHSLVLSTGNLFVPIVAHSVQETFFGTLAHVKVF